MWDVSMLGQVPGIRVAAPRHKVRLPQLLNEAVSDDHGPTAVRYPGGSAPQAIPAFGPPGSADLLPPAEVDHQILLIPIGALASTALDAAEPLRAEGLQVAVADPRWIIPVDPALTQGAARHQLVVTIEDNAAPGGFGDALAWSLRVSGLPVALLTLTLADGFVAAGERASVHKLHRLPAGGTAAQVAGPSRP